MIFYAVYTFSSGKWWVEKNFDDIRKDEAIELATDISRTTPNVPVKVVREDHDSSSGLFTERVVLQLEFGRPVSNRPADRAADRASAKPIPFHDSRERSRPAAGASRPAVPKAPSKPQDLSVLRALLTTVPVGIIIGIAFAVFMYRLIIESGNPQLIVIGASINALLAYFLVVSFGVTAFLLYRYYPHLVLSDRRRRTGKGEGSGGDGATAAMSTRLAPTDGGWLADPGAAPTTTEPSPPPAAVEEPKPPGKPGAIEENGGRELGAFFADSLYRALSQTRPSDKRTHIFGCHLFLAGLSEEVGRAQGWLDADRRAYMLKLLAQITPSQEQSEKFMRHYEEYLVTPRHMEIYQAGQIAGRAYIGSIAGANLSLAAALTQWSKRAAADDNALPAVVMFTDMVGSTDFASQHGDIKHMQQVRAHDQIVSAVMAHCHGTMIKHTGDGTMASFQSPIDAVRASLMIQESMVAHCKANPEIPIHLRIGINSGAAIREGDDLFGSTVQMAARICAAANTDQIFIGPGVAEACKSASFRIISKGPRRLKGFPEPIELHQVIWSNDDSGSAATEIVPPPAAG